MTHGNDSPFHTGQLVWVVAPGGSRRPAEFIGEGESAGRSHGVAEVLVIYVDTPGFDVIMIERLRPREGLTRGARGPGDAATRRAEPAPRQRGRAATRRATELNDTRAHPQGQARFGEGAECVLRATEVAEEAQLSAAEAVARAADAFGRAARAHERAAEAAECCGDALGPLHREAARQDDRAAQRAHREGVEARERFEALRLHDQRKLAVGAQ